MSVKGKKKTEWVAQTFCDFNDSGRKSVLRNHFSMEAAFRAFKKFVKDRSIYGNIWLKTRDGKILKDTRILTVNSGMQITHLKSILHEMMNLTQRLQTFRMSAGLLHDIATEMANVCGRSIGKKNRLIISEEHCDAMLTIEGVSVICCGIRPKSVDKYTPSVVGFVCGKIVYDPGVYRYSDGSGEPPSEDFNEEFTTTSHREAAIYLMRTVLDIELSQVVQSMDEAEMAKQIQHEAEQVF
jgi:hypothetical protein|tara:strand:+ start:2759 stop:3478 length:720 start_codon:yes stop_codon:yes gene_type:complete